ncbi:hypothetical protein ACGFX8_37920 [Streptomyces sp. NPDC048362]
MLHRSGPEARAEDLLVRVACGDTEAFAGVATQPQSLQTSAHTPG